MKDIANIQLESQDLSSGQASMLINGMIDNCIDQIESSLDSRENKEADSIGEQLQFINTLQSQITSQISEVAGKKSKGHHSHDNCK